MDDADEATPEQLLRALRELDAGAGEGYWDLGIRELTELGLQLELAAARVNWLWRETIEREALPPGR